MVDWQAALEFCYRSQLALVFGAAAGGALPEEVRAQLARNLADNTERLASVHDLERQVSEWLAAAGIEFIFLKGTTQWPHFVAEPQLRAQYDVDLLCNAEDARRAWDLIAARGYEPLPGSGEYATDHLPTLIRKTGWRVSGNYFDPELPHSIELHYQFWNEETEGLRAPGVEEFWTRRQGQALDTPDALGYAALHLLRHLLRGSASAYHVYELAWFLEHHAADQEFWHRWQALHEPALRRLEAIAFRLAREWFGCALGQVAEEEVSRLPAAVSDWFDLFAASPLEGIFHPNKDELWLHLALLDTMRSKLAVLRRRLLPLRLPGPVDDTLLVPAEQIHWIDRLRNRVQNARYLAERLVYHGRALGAVIASGVRWRMRSAGMSGGYWMFLGASSFLNLGLFIYALLYNLYLMDLGYREDFVGLAAGATSAGLIAGALPAAALAHRFALGRLLFWCFAATGVTAVLRVLLTSPAPLLGLSFLNGLVFSVFAVSLAPAIARLTTEKARSIGFSISTASSIALGILGGWLGGQLPGWLGGKRPALLAGCALAFLSLWPAARLRIAPAPSEGAKLYPRSRFVVRFLMVFALWNLATGAFNPFFNMYFAGHLHTPVERIGLIFSASQFAQVAALMLAPMVLRRLGLVSGTAAMLMATAVALSALAAGPAGWMAAAVYAVFMAFQYMSDPGINTLLMGRVRDEERSGAAALMMLASFAAQFVASFAGGRAITRFGYPAVLACAAALAALAAVAFRTMLGAGGTPAAEAADAIPAWYNFSSTSRATTMPPAGYANMLARAVATVWRREWRFGIILVLATACASALVFFSTAIWGNNRESGLFVLVGLIAFGGVLVTLLWVLGLAKNVIVEWMRLRAQKQNAEPTGSMVSPATEAPARSVVEGRTVAADDQRRVSPDQRLTVHRRKNDSRTFSLGYLPNTVGTVGAVIGMIVSISVGKGAEAITLTGKLAGLGFMIGYPIGALARAAIMRWSKSRQ